MRQVFLIGLVTLLTSCDRQNDVITEKSPFMEVLVETPPDGGVGVAKRSSEFARKNEMKFKYSFEHFSNEEYSVRLLRPDFNVAVDNVLRGKKSVVSMYSRHEPNNSQRKLAKEYLCSVMRHGCGSIS